MMTFILALFLAPPALPAPLQEATPLIDNNRVTVREVNSAAGKAAPTDGRNHDRVVIDLVKTTAFFVPKGAVYGMSGHAILIDLKDVSIPPVPNQTPYPLAFPREGVKKILENNRVIIWDYTWTPGKPTAMHFHDKDVVVVYLADGQLVDLSHLKANMRVFVLAGKDLYDEVEAYQVIWGKILSPAQ